MNRKFVADRPTINMLCSNDYYSCGLTFHISSPVGTTYSSLGRKAQENVQQQTPKARRGGVKRTALINVAPPGLVIV